MASTSTQKNNKGITFGLIFFDSSDVSASGDKYRLVIESARFADRHDFSSVWIPERHFTREGWLYPNPVVLHAALARETQQIHLRAGSVVMPLHDPIRVAEEWAMVDNLSGGRVGISFASGWHPNDFVFFPDNYAQRNELMYQGIETVRKLWRGESIQVKGGDGKLVDVRTYPTPIQAELPFWVTAAGNPKTFAGAGKMGAHLLTHMYNQSVDELAEKIRIYRDSLAENGFDPQSGQVSVMLHTFVSYSQEAVLAQAGGPFRNYLRSAGHLLNAIAYSRGQKVDLASLSEQDVEEYLHFVFERLVSTQRVLFGTPESCLNLIKQLYAAGVNEVACQIDFGLDTDVALSNMVYLNQLKDLANAELANAAGPDAPANTWSVVSGATVRPVHSSNGNSTPTVKEQVSRRQDRLEDVQKRCREDVSVTTFYDRLHTRGIELSTSFRGIERLWRGDGEALGRVHLLDTLADESQLYQVHPTLLDACLQVLIATLPDGLQNSDSALYLPTGLRSFKLHKRPGKQVWSHALLTTDAHAGSLEGDVRILDENGQLLVEVQGIQLQRSDAGSTSPKVQETQASELSEWLYELRWEVQATDGEPYRSKEGIGKWLIFADQGGVGRKLAELLAEQGETTFTVTAGETYRESGRRQYVVNPQQPDDVQRVITSVLQDGAAPFRGVMHLWSLDATPEQQTTSASLERDQALGVGHALSVVQGLISIEGTAAPRLWLVTRGAQAVETQPTTVAIAQSPLWGLGRTCAMELPELWGGLVDLDTGSSLAESAAQLLSVAGEDRNDSKEDQLAFRQGQRYVARMVRHAAETKPAQPSVQVRADASYLITGGLWGLGLEVARWLAQKGARHLILAGRSSLPERVAWDSVEPGSRVARQIAGVRELEALGVHVHYAALDVADEAQITTFLDSYRRQGHPPIKGVMHAASVWQDQQGQSLVRPLVNLDADALKAVFRPKVWGAWLLHSLLKDAALDFFVSFSSGASLFGSAAQGNYAAAGAFLDALAHHQRAVGVPAISFDWGAVSEIGFGGTAEGQRVHEYWETHGIQRITPRHVLAALDLFIPQNVAQIGVLKLDWQLLREFFPQIASLPLVSYLVAETASKDATGKSETGKGVTPQSTVDQNGSGIVATILSASVEQRQHVMETYLSEQVAGVLRVPAARLDNEQPLTTLGLDSLMAIELKNRIELELKVRIPIVTFLQGPSIRQFATQVLDQLAELETSVAAEPAAIVVAQSEQEKSRQNIEEVTILNEVKAEQLLGELEQLSDAEVDALLSQMLEEDNNQVTKAVSTNPAGDGNGVMKHEGNDKQVSAEDAEALLAQLDQLGDDEVNALLSQMVQEEELNR